MGCSGSIATVLVPRLADGKKSPPHLSGGTLELGPEDNVAEQFNISVREWHLKSCDSVSAVLETIPREKDVFRAQRTYSLSDSGHAD